MALQGGEDVYATLLLNDTYLPGALVLAHSLRDAGTSKQLAILVTLDTVSAEAVTQLKTVFDHVISVPRIKNDVTRANLDQMNRPDLHSAFTKINLWKQAQFRKIVYIDADVVAYRAPDELFDLPHAFAAAPDIGWPDLFNTGVMVITPDVGEYYALLALAQRGISFDGADQGLLNMHFKNSYHRLSFTYNVTPSAHYQYIPAYRHFKSSINMVHFIGPDKPWTQSRGMLSASDAYDEMVGRWWSVYDRHYRKASPPPPGSNLPSRPQPPEIVQYFVKGEFQPTITHRLTADDFSYNRENSSYGQHFDTLPPPPEPQPSFNYREHHQQALSYEHNHHHHHHHSPQSQLQPEPDHHVQHGRDGERHEHGEHQEHSEHQEPREHWEHGEAPAELGHITRAHTPPQIHTPPQSHTPPRYEPSSSPPSASVAVLPANMETENREDQVSEGHQGEVYHPPAPEHKNEPERPPMEPSWDAQWQPPPVNAKPEAMNFPRTHYEMSHDTAPFVPPERYPSPPRDMWYDVPKEAPAPVYERPHPIFPWEGHQPAPTRVFAEPVPPLSHDEEQPGQFGSYPHRPHQGPGAEPSMTSGSPSVDLRTEPATPVMPSAARQYPPSDPWGSFARTNAWDDVPQIERYVDSFQKQHRRVRSRGQAFGGIRLGSLAGNFASSRGGDGEQRGSKVTDFPSEAERPSLPVTPAPIRRPKFWGGGGRGFGSNGDADDDHHLLPAAEGVPQQSDWDPVAQLQKLAKQQSEMLLRKLGTEVGSGNGTEEAEGGKWKEGTGKTTGGESPTSVAETTARVISPTPLKPGSLEMNIVRSMGNYSGEDTATGSTIADPSYLGPGLAFDKDEGFLDHEMAAAMPSEEEMDVLET